MDPFLKVGQSEKLEQSFELEKMEKQLQVRLNNIQRFKREFPHLKDLPVR